MTAFTESVVEDAVLAWLESLGYAVKHLPAPQNETTRQAGGPEIAPGEFLPERTDYGDIDAAELRAAVSAKSATTQRESNMQKMHFALVIPAYGLI